MTCRDRSPAPPARGPGRRRLQGLVLLGAAGMAAPAAAQSHVAMYGNLDLGIVKTSGQALRMERGYNNWLGLRGQEELGQGLSAVFTLEARFNPDTGRQERTGTLWQGQSTVGLRSESAGTLLLGRALTPLWNSVWKFEPWVNSGFNASLSAYQTGRYSSDGVDDAEREFADFSRMSNGIYYASPELSGLSLQAAAGVERGSGADARPAGFAFNYAGTQLSAAASYEHNRRRDRIRYLALSWSFAPLKLMGSYTWNSLRGSGSERAMLLAGILHLGTDKLRMGYGRNPNLNSHKTSVGYVHPLSVRTNVYADLYHEHTVGQASGIAFGMNHAF